MDEALTVGLGDDNKNPICEPSSWKSNQGTTVNISHLIEATSQEMILRAPFISRI